MFSSKFKQVVQSIVALPKQIIQYLAGAISDIFAPSKDDYPETGVQPYDGNSGKK